MVVLLNLLLPAIFVILAVVAYKTKRGFWMALFIPVVIIYGMIQPSYLPKGTAKPAAPPAEFVAPEGDIVDRMAKPLDADARDARRKAAFDEAENRRQEFLKNIEEEKQ